MIRSLLLTGGTGLLGAEVVEQLPEEVTVYSIVRSSSSLPIGQRANVRFIEADLTQPLDASVLPKQVDAIAHLAQSEHYRNFPLHANEVFSVNTTTTLSLLDYARDVGAKSFLYASAGKPFGVDAAKFLNGDPDPTRKDVSFYLTTKLCSELMVNCYAQFMTTIVLRFFFIYGPQQHDRMLIPRLIRSVVQGDPITVAGDRGVTVSPIYVSDAARAVIKALTLNRSIKFDVGGIERIALRDVVEIIGEMTHRTPVISMQPDLPMEEVCADTDTMIEAVGAPTVTFRQGLEQVLATGRWS